MESLTIMLYLKEINIFFLVAITKSAHTSTDSILKQNTRVTPNNTRPISNPSQSHAVINPSKESQSQSAVICHVMR